MFQFVLILAVAWFFFRYTEKKRLEERRRNDRFHSRDSFEVKGKSRRADDDDEGEFIDYEEVK